MWLWKLYFKQFKGMYLKARSYTKAVLWKCGTDAWIHDNTDGGAWLYKVVYKANNKHLEHHHRLQAIIGLSVQRVWEESGLRK